MIARVLSPLDAKALVHAPGEIAMLDVREHGQYGGGHPFLAVSCPYSRLEIVISSLVPRREVPVLLVDDGDGIAEKAAAVLADLGYGNVSWIEGGAPAWAAADLVLFKGVNLPSKTLGELLEELWHIPHINADTLDAWTRERCNFHLFDGRPASEHCKMTIPGAVSAPNGELPHRFDMLVDDHTAPVVVHCAGRTRSLVGAAGLALAGIPNPVFALEDGTQGWALSGRSLETKRKAPILDALDADASAASARRAEAIIARHAIPRIDRAGLKRLAKDRSRTLYVFDVRTAEEHAAGTLLGAVHAPAVQLIQATDHWVGVRRARIVLFDDTGLRAALTAVFLRAMNYEVFVLTAADAGELLALGRRAVSLDEMPQINTIEIADALAEISAGAMLLDLRSSFDYRAAHIEQAHWTVRPRLRQALMNVDRPVLLAGMQDITALAAKDLTALGARNVRRVRGNPMSWKAAGIRVVATSNEPPDEAAIDYLFFVHDRHDGNLEAARRYLAWEKGLVEKLDAAERREYRIGDNPFAERAG